MPRKNEAKLRKKEKAAFIRRQKAWTAYAEACKHTGESYNKTEEIWSSGMNAKEAMNEAFRAMEEKLGRKPMANEYSPEYLAARQEFLRLKNAHVAAKTEYELNKARRNHCNAVYDSACAEHDQAKEKLMAVLSDRPKHNEDTAIKEVDMAQVHTKPFYLANIFGKNAVVDKRRDGSGKIDIYFDGIADNGGGIGHGHAVIDSTGKVVYLRDAWCDHNDSIINDYHPDAPYHPSSSAP